MMNARRESRSVLRVDAAEGRRAGAGGRDGRSAAATVAGGAAPAVMPAPASAALVGRTAARKVSSSDGSRLTKSSSSYRGRGLDDAA